MDKKFDTTVDKYEVASSDDDNIKVVQKHAAIGAVQVTDDKEVFLIPSPSSDPRDPLNLPKWRKVVFILLLSTFSSLGLALVSGFGGLLQFYIPDYTAHGATYSDITALMTYPSMFMGVGNLVLMPIAMAMGRRPVFLFSCILLAASAIGAAYVKDYNTHLAIRMVLGLAAGQSEALVPMMIQEIHFLHERSQFLMWQSAIQTIISAVYILFASPIAGAIGPGKWYILGGSLSVLVFLLSIFFVPEPKYHRTLAAYGQVEDANDPAAESRPVRITERPALDFIRYEPRTLRSDMRLFVNKMDWAEGVYTFIHTFQILFFPNVFWAFLLNGITIGVNIALGTTYSAIITAPPYNWPDRTASYVNTGQIVVALIALPLLGNGSDYVIKWRARRHGGIHYPENRLLLLWIPVTIGVIASVIYGQAGAHPDKYHWFAIVWSYAAYYFAFVGANIAAITYLLDAYPTRAAPVLVVITAFRGFVSFGTSYGVAKFVETSGYDGSFGTYGGLTAALGLLGVPVFLYGKQIRRFTEKWVVKETAGPSMSH